MGGRSSKVTVSRAGGGDSTPTDAAILKALGSEYASSKHPTGSGRIAWDFKDYTAPRSKEGDSDEVFLVDRTQPSGGGAFPASLSDKLRSQAPVGTGDKGVAHEAIATSAASPTEAQKFHQPAAGDRTGAASAAAGLAHSQAKTPIIGTGPAADSASKHKRPATGKSKEPRNKRNGRAPEMPAPAAPPAAAAAVAAAVVAAAGVATAARDNGVAPASGAAANGTRTVPAAAAQPKLGGGADAAVAATGCGGGGPPTGAATPSDGASAAAAAAVQWVIRPGPPIESAYKLGKVLGQGSFGVVRGATHLVSGTEVAVKTIRKSLLRSADVASLRLEVEILHHLSGHPAISQLLGVYEEPRQLHLVLELYKGGDLFDAIIGVGRHSERTAADVLRTVLTAIGYCHAMGVAHRDIKPENFMLTAELPKDFQPQSQPPQPPPQPQQPQQQRPGVKQIPLAPPLIGIGSRLKLIDFGLSAFCTDDTPLTEIVGTSYYVAPEVLEGRYSLAADVWSAGVILHIMLTGYAPFDGKDDREILKAVRKGKLDLSADPVWKSISAEAAAVLVVMLDRDPKKRATADQVLAMPWLGRTADACEAPCAPLPGVVSERMHRFARMSSFKKEARRVVAGLMRPEEVAGLVAQFQGMDTDRDGRISLAELREGIARQTLLRRASQGPAPLSEEKLKELLRRSDLNGDGLLDESEFLGAALPAAALTRQALAAASASRPVSSSAGGGAARQSSAIAAAFKHFDTDGSGFITAEELRRALAAHHPSGKGLDVEALLSRHDRDADGRISYPEFVDMLVQDVDDDEDDMYDTTVHGRRHEQQQQRPAPPSAGDAPRFSGSGGGGGAASASAIGTLGISRAPPKNRDSASAWGVSEREPSSAGAAAAKGRASRAVSRSSTAAAQRPSGRMSPLEWSDECMDTDDEAAPPPPPSPPAAAVGPVHDAVLAAAAGKAAEMAALAAVRGSAGGGGGTGATAPRIPSRFSQQPPPSPAAGRDASASATLPRVAVRCASISGANRRGSIGGYGAPSPDAAGDLGGGGGGGGLYRLEEVQDVAACEAELYGGSGADAAAAAPPMQLSGRRAPPPPPMQLPAQPAADRRSRRHSAGGVLQYDRGLMVIGGGGSDGSGSGGGSPMHGADPRAAPPAARLHHPTNPTDQSSGYNFTGGSPMHGTARSGGGGAASSLPGSPAAAAAAAAQRVVAGRFSTGQAQQQPQQPPPPPLLQQQRPPQLLGLGMLLPALQTSLASPSAEKLSERASCPQTAVGWPLSPGGGAATARPNRASVTGMLPVRNPPPWPAAAAAAPSVAAAIAAGMQAAAPAGTASAALRAVPPSEPLPALHTAGLRSRRQSTGCSPVWPLAQAAAAATAAAPAPPASPAPRSSPLYQIPAASQQLQLRNNYSVSCSGTSGGGGYVNSVNALSPRAPTATEWASGGGGGGASSAAAATLPAGRRSRRSTQPGLMPSSNAEELIITSRASMDLDAGAAPRGFPASSEEDASMSHILPPGATGLGLGAPYLPYRPMMTSASGRLL